MRLWACGIGRRYKPLPPKALEQIAAELSDHHSQGVRVYTSQDAGMGKTFSVRLAARQRGLSVVHVPVYTGLPPPDLLRRIHTAMVPHCIQAALVPNAKGRDAGMGIFNLHRRDALAAILDDVAGGSSVEDAARRWAQQRAKAYALRAGATLRPPRLCLHFDLGSTCDASLDSAIFELCWMGGLVPSGAASGAQLRWDPAYTAISIELANSHPLMLEVLPSCMSLQQHVCAVSQQEFCSDTQALTMGRMRWGDFSVLANVAPAAVRVAAARGG